MKKTTLTILIALSLLLSGNSEAQVKSRNSFIEWNFGMAYIEDWSQTSVLTFSRELQFFGEEHISMTIILFLNMKQDLRYHQLLLVNWE